LFNYLFARRHGGQYLLRIEDTDRARSTEDAVRQILDSLEWLGLQPDETPVFQSRREARHAEVARELLAAGRAYLAFDTPEELQAARERAVAESGSRRRARAKRSCPIWCRARSAFPTPNWTT
jgi:glutamyl-tRNA synthetase